MGQINHAALVTSTLNNGFKWAHIATSTDDTTQQQIAIQNTTRLLGLISPPEYCTPKASFGLGVLAHHMAIQSLNGPFVKQEERLTTAFQFFADAAEHFETAANMPDYQHDLTPARAKDSLALLCELGVLKDGTKDLITAFDLRLEAAETGFAEAQMNVAVMYYNGEGTERSLECAHHWMSEALGNAKQLLPEYQTQVLDDLKIINAELTSAPIPSAPNRMSGIKPGWTTYKFFSAIEFK